MYFRLTYPSTIVHDRLDKFSTGTDHCIVDLSWDLDLLAGDVGHLVLDLLDLGHGLVDVGLLAGDGDHVALRAGVREVDLGVGLVTNSADVCPTLSDNILVELLEDGNFHLYKRTI